VLGCVWELVALPLTRSVFCWRVLLICLPPLHRLRRLGLLLLLLLLRIASSIRRCARHCCIAPPRDACDLGLRLPLAPALAVRAALLCSRLLATTLLELRVPMALLHRGALRLLFGLPRRANNLALVRPAASSLLLWQLPSLRLLPALLAALLP